MAKRQVLNSDYAALEAQLDERAPYTDAAVISGESWIEFALSPGRLYIHNPSQCDGPDTYQPNLVGCVIRESGGDGRARR